MRLFYIHGTLTPDFKLITIFIHSFIHSFISGQHHYECIAPNVDINLQSGWFWATSIASFRDWFQVWWAPPVLQGGSC